MPKTATLNQEGNLVTSRDVIATVLVGSVALALFAAIWGFFGSEGSDVSAYEGTIPGAAAKKTMPLPGPTARPEGAPMWATKSGLAADGPNPGPTFAPAK
ncbi:MAG: hypothetical protein H6917_01035 [Novosphingobium sp.]|nr:hypothetical protein [Novosphingobium sp.]